MKKIFITALTAVLSVMAANAQQCDQKKACCGKFTPSWFVQFQGGVQMPYTPGDKGDLLSPAWAINVGRNINPLVSVRLGIEGVNSKVFNEFSGEKENFKYATGSFDAMLNVTNIFTKKYCHPVNFYLLGGVGCNWSGMETTNSSKFSPAVRLGAQLDWRVAKNVALNLEYRATNTNDQFNGRLESGSHDWYSAIYLGVSLVLPDRKAVKDRSGEIDALNAQINALRAENEALKNRKPEVKVVETVKTVVEKEAILPNVFFAVSKSTISKQQSANVKAIADYMKANPEVKVTINGYASTDGNAKFNQKLSGNRAQAVADMLVKKHGIDASRITTVANGPTGDIYPERELNRVAVSVAK
ncbi:MAG: OmpA family protein [Bacteroidales bacterium]|nr:OmpA family protein [Bacteroidales bacterium]MCM1147699.1 OmpA family protein [Bacteroidales bacterium]MCM1206772.1 OmpA family protein [Bacillota bacterium]MCM1510672.1 OmpA family protein [Clostridium sp.]